ncbi:hypothetical protein KPH14_003078 [Odynerus spinipes]|uniref:Uncharacterized protein n=1 Tax=Odynerus spinipes TaxID=1348599 RepID=A0AAD9RY59_9HYME|nr:hypothetical protein KPH14_003078 [Odynerus spinipes]
MMRSIEREMQPSCSSGPHKFRTSFEGSEACQRVSKNPRTLQKKNETDSDGEKERIIAVQRDNVETKAAFTQTCKSWSDQEQKNLSMEETDYLSRSTPSLFYDDQRKWDVVEDPAPQWLIEEALNRGNEVCKEYENIISELEKKLSETKNELGEALKKKIIVKEKYKRMLQNVKMEASKHNEALQGKIVHIYTSLLDKFEPYLLNNKKNGCQNKNRRPSRYFGKLSRRLYKKLQIAIKISKKLKDELSRTREQLTDKSTQYESMNKCFELLKQEMESTELNLNDLIAENSSLRKKFEDMKEWMELKIGKEQNERISATQIRELPKYRELANLKKKSEEDCTTIKQLHNKLLRSESANANKGFLLNSYKGQLSDLTKEKDQLISKIKELENEVNLLRTSNAQLKAKVSLINQEKENLIGKVEKSETDLKHEEQKIRIYHQQIESQLNRKYEESMREEINTVKTKCENAIKVLKEQLSTFESKNTEYSKAIKEFLKKIHDHCMEQVDQSFFKNEASEREAHETACNILNMTPEELATFMNERSSTVVETPKKLFFIPQQTKHHFLYRSTLGYRI